MHAYTQTYTHTYMHTFSHTRIHTLQTCLYKDVVSTDAERKQIPVIKVSTHPQGDTPWVNLIRYHGYTLWVYISTLVKDRLVDLR